MTKTMSSVQQMQKKTGFYSYAKENLKVEFEKICKK